MNPNQALKETPMTAAFALTLIALGFCLGVMSVGGAFAMLVRKDVAKATHRQAPKTPVQEPYDQETDNAGLTILDYRKA